MTRRYPGAGWLCSAGSVPPPSWQAGRPEPLPRAVLARPVLVIEDESMIAWMLESLLEDMGFETVATAATGEEAIAAAEALRPGLVISDINLGTRGMDGIAAVAVITAQRQMPVLFVTAYAGEDSMARIERHVPHALVLRKPVGPAHLQRRIADALSGPQPH